MAMKEVQGLMKPLKKYAKMTLTAVFSSRRKRPAKAPSYEFTHFAIKIDIKGPGWQKTVAKLLGGIHGVSHFNMEDDGTVEISGTVTPTQLLKRLAKARTMTTMKHWQFGKSSSNLYAVPNLYSYNNSSYYPQGRRYDYPSYGGNMYDYPANGGYDYGYPRGNSHHCARNGGYDYQSAPYEENGYGYGGYLGSSSHHGRGQEYGYCRY